ncbi:MAG: ATP-binding protein [Tunicatimonas sp.]
MNILLVDDDEDDYVLVRDLLNDMEQTDFRTEWISEYDKGLARVLENQHDVYLIDYRLGKKNGLDLLQAAIAQGVRAPIIMLTGKGVPEVDLQAMRMGAADYLVKGQVSAPTIERSIRYALKNARTISQLHQEERRYRSLFEQSINAIYITDEHLRFTDANVSMLRLFAYDMDRLQQQRLPELFTIENDLSDFKQELFSYHLVRDFEAILQRSDGKVVACSLSAASLTDVNGNITGYQGVIVDISEKKKVQQELIRLEKLMMTGNIARSIAHEVRNPLTNIGLSLEQLRSEPADSDDATIYYDIIKRNVGRINELITAMLNSSKPSQLDLQPQLLNQVIDEAVAIAEDRLRLQEVTLEKRYAEGLPPLPLDQEKIKMALLNIINNAIEAVPTGTGRITIKTGEDARNQYVQITDNGPGIESDILDKLFDAFHTSKSGGMGLGLTATQNIINSHEGKIYPTSTPGEGATFTIAFKKRFKLRK